MRDSSNADKWSIRADTAMKIILFVLVAFLPLIVHPYTKLNISPLLRGEIMLSTGNMTELFNHYKFLIFVSAIILLNLLFLSKIMFLKQPVINHAINLPMVLIFISLILSLLFAPYKTVVLFGNWARYEGTITFICYLSLLFIVSNLSFKRRDIVVLFSCFIPLIVVNVVLAVTSFFSIDVFSWHFMESMFFGGLPHQNFLHGELLRTTLENQDYLSAIGGVLTALFFTMAVIVNGLKNKLIWTVPTLLSFVLVASSEALSGLFSAAVCILLVFVVIFLQPRKRDKTVAFSLLLVVMGIIFVAFNHFGSNMEAKSLSYLQTKSANSITQIQPKSQPTAKADSQGPKDYGLNLPPTKSSFGTGRMFIWQKTIELIEKRPIVGYGLDTLAYFFPQDDIGFKTDYGMMNVFEDKPHSLYLDFAFGAGVLALIGFIWLNFSNLICCAKLLQNPTTRPKISLELISINIAIVAYLVQGLVNDSILSTGFIFWILLGVSTSMMHGLKTGDSSKNAGQQ